MGSERGRANLRPLKAGTDRAREVAAMGGRASGEARRRAKAVAQLADAALSCRLPAKDAKAVRSMLPDLGDEDVTWAAATVAGQLRAAAGGSTPAFESLMAVQDRARAAEAGDGAGRGFVRDFGLLVAPPHLAPHRAVAAGVGCDLWLYGGRLSGKSSYISLEIVNLLMQHEDYSALVCMKVGRDMRGGVYEQMLWALDKMGVADEWVATVSPMRIVRPSTGQAIVFRGCDNASKSKSIKAPVGTYFAVQWFEEADQFSGLSEIRTVQQSATRGAGEGAPFFRFYSFNPPRSRDSWSNKVIADRLARGLPVYTSSYLDMPPEWVPEQFRADALALKEVDEESYRHEYLGEAVGYGAEVFPRAVVRQVTDDERRGLERFVYGVDWGFAADPFVWFKAAYLPGTRTLYVLDEVSGLGLSNPESARLVSGRMQADRLGADGRVVEDAEPYARVMCDSAEPKSIDEWLNLGIRAEAAPKQGAHSVRSGVRWLQDRAAIVVDPSCRVAARELVGYQYAHTPQGELTSRLVDADNHAIDALRYACATLIDDRSVV